MQAKTVREINLDQHEVILTAEGFGAGEILCFGVRFEGAKGADYATLAELTREGDNWSLDVFRLFPFFRWNKQIIIDLLCLDLVSGKYAPCSCEDNLFLDEGNQIVNGPNADFIFALLRGEKKECRLGVTWSTKINPFCMQQQTAAGVCPCFLISNIPAKGKTFFARRENKARDFLYDAMVPAIHQNGYLELKSQPVYEAMEHSGEIWDLVIEDEGLLFPVRISEVESDYIEVNADISVKPFISEGCFSLFTKEGTHLGKKKVRVAVMGTCYGRQIFNSYPYFNKDYKRRFECVATIFHQSLCSMVAPATAFELGDTSKLTHKKLVNMYAEDEFQKTGFDKLREASPDYILIDLFNEAHACLFAKDNGEMITDAFYLEGCAPLKNYHYDRLIRPNSLERFAMFEEACKKVRARLAEIIDLHRIVLVKAKSAVQYFDAKGAKKSFPDEPWIFNFDHYLFRYQSIFMKIFPEARVIEMRDGDYAGDERSPLTLSRNHFESRYYRDGLIKLERIVIEDSLR